MNKISNMEKGDSNINQANISRELSIKVILSKAHYIKVKVKLNT